MLPTRARPAHRHCAPGSAGCLASIAYDVHPVSLTTAGRRVGRRPTYERTLDTTAARHPAIEDAARQRRGAWFEGAQVLTWICSKLLVCPASIHEHSRRRSGAERLAWSTIETAWSTTIDQARGLSESTLLERVNNEWSFVETLRHLLFVTDAWIGRAVLGQVRPYHRLGLPPDHRIGEPQDGVDVTTWGIDVCADASFEEVVAARNTRTMMVRDVMDTIAAEMLSQPCPPNPAAGFPPSTALPIGTCLDVVVGEEWAHHGFATRDLTLLANR